MVSTVRQNKICSDLILLFEPTPFHYRMQGEKKKQVPEVPSSPLVKNGSELLTYKTNHLGLS